MPSRGEAWIPISWSATQQALLAIWQDLPFVFTVGDDHGCQQAFFYNWPAIYGGPLWGETEPGDTIRVWIVDVDGVLLFIEGTTTTEASPALEEELQMFIDSIRFE